jgi:hypothetical protein
MTLYYSNGKFSDKEASTTFSLDNINKFDLILGLLGIMGIILFIYNQNLGLLLILLFVIFINMEVD